MPDFDDAFRHVIGIEGGYVNDPNDAGGETKYGISKRSYSNEDIRGLTLDRAKEIYRRDFWRPLHGDDLPYAVALQLFDGAIHSGVGTAIRWMQAAAGVAADGAIGPVTLKAWRGADPAALTARYNGHRLHYLTDLTRWSKYHRGWARRIATNLRSVPLTPPPVVGASGLPEDVLEALDILADTPASLPAVIAWLQRIAADAQGAADAQDLVA